MDILKHIKDDGKLTELDISVLDENLHLTTLDYRSFIYPISSKSVTDFLSQKAKESK